MSVFHDYINLNVRIRTQDLESQFQGCLDKRGIIALTTPSYKNK